MLAIFSAAFSAPGRSARPATRGLGRRRYYLPGMLAAGMLLVGRAEPRGRHRDGEERRHAQAPRRHAAAAVSATSSARSARCSSPARCRRRCCSSSPRWLVLGVELPTEPEAWFTFAWVFVLGVTTSALLGIALSALPRSGKSATAVVIPIVLVLQFISGVYLQFTHAARVAAERREPLPAEVDGAGHALGVPARGLRGARAGRDVEPRRASRSRSASGSSSGSCSAALTFRWIRRDA